LHQSADPVVVNAQRFITEHLDQSIGVNDVARATGVCRRLLERRMRQMLQKTPLQEIRRQRIQRAQALLIGGDLTLNQIAIACGFNTAPLFSEIFRKETGLTPGKYRQQQR